MEIDTTPPQTIVADHEFERAPYWLRVMANDATQSVAIVELCDEHGPVKSLPAAVQAAHRAGYAPTHWIAGRRGPTEIPRSIQVR